jgi:hypothetical protein
MKNVFSQTLASAILTSLIIFQVDAAQAAKPTPKPTAAPTPKPTPAPTASPSTASGPYTSLTVPGRIQAEYFNNGGSGVGYYDTSYGNQGTDFSRDTDVDLEMSTDGTPNIGWIDHGEWWEYTVQANSGIYSLKATVASPSSSSEIAVQVNGTGYGNLSVPYTGDWQSWESTSSISIVLSQGQNVIRLYSVGGAFNINHFEVTSQSATATPAPTPAPTAAPVTSTPYKTVQIPGTFQAEDFDNGGSGVAYGDGDAGNNGNYPNRGGDVDLQYVTPGVCVGWIGTGEWTKYTVQISTTGTSPSPRESPVPLAKVA